MSATNAAADPRNRRECFRINDRVALRLRVLKESEFRAAKAAARHRSELHGAVSSIIATGEKQRSALRNLRDQHPALASYLQSVEQRIDALARLALRDEHIADEPTHDVNISGSGIRLYVAQPLAKGTCVELELQLFPSRLYLKLHGTVVWCNEQRSKHGVALAVDYSDIHEDDRELLIRHIHALQLDYVRRGVRRD